MDKSLLLALLVCAAFATGVFLCLSLDSEVLCHGDMHTDIRALVAADQFNDHGFDTLHWTQVEDGGSAAGLEPTWYFRHPSGGVVALALLQRAGVPVTWARLVPLLATTLGLLGFFLAVRSATGDPPLAVASAAALACLSPFFLIADSFQLYSYALGAKGVCFGLIAFGLRRTRAPRLRAYAAAGVLAFLCTTALGLETLPAIGLFSFFCPLLVAPGGLRGRLASAVLGAACVGGGMAIGAFLRVLHMSAVVEGGIDGVLNNLAGSLEQRSSGGEEQYHGRGYVAELVYRAVNYMAVHLGVIALGAITWIVAMARGRRPLGRRSFVSFAAAVVLSEGLYFVFMRQHVHVHVHTAVHFSFSIAVLAGGAVRVLQRTFLGGRTGRYASSALILGLSLTAVLVVPLRPYGNLQVDSDVLRNVVSRFQKLTPHVVPDGLVVIALADSRDWGERYAIVHSGRDFISLKDRGDLGVLAGRIMATVEGPLYALIDNAPTSPIHRVAAALGRRVSGDDRYVLFAVANYDASGLPAEERPVSPNELKRAKRTTPAETAIQSADVRYRLFRRVGSMLFLHAPPPRFADPTSVVVELEQAVTQVSGAVCEVRYGPVPALEQPRVLVTLEVLGGRAPQEALLASRTLELDPAEGWQTLAAPVTPAAGVRALRLTVRVSPRSSGNLGAGVHCRSLALRLR